jgi:hypothetical protein
MNSLASFQRAVKMPEYNYLRISQQMLEKISGHQTLSPRLLILKLIALLLD